MTKRLVVISSIALASFALALTLRNSSGHYWSRDDDETDLKFSHTLHVKDNGIACEDCHLTAKTSKFSSDNLIGDHETCKTCHEEQVTDNCAYCHTNKDDIKPFKKRERELLFSHEVHTTRDSIQCERCHAGVENAVLATGENMPSMTTCVTCHNEKSASIQCESCHTDFVSLVPDDHLAGDFRKHHKELTRLGMTDVSCATCHAESFCQDCHTGTELQSLGFKKDLMSEPSSRSSTKDSPKQLRLQQAHGLNYRYTHGIDAKSKILDCASCHEQQSFCATCHEAGGNISQGTFKPESHRIAGFTTIGKGTGGGRHAELARRDIESCAACHDVQGSDPTCMLCHSETGVVR